MMVRAVEGDEVAHGTAAGGESSINEGCLVSLLPYFPMVLTVKDVFLLERDFPREPYLRQKRNFEREGEHRPEMRNAYDNMRTRHAREFCDRTVKLLKRQMLQNFKRACNVKRLVFKR